MTLFDWHILRTEHRYYPLTAICGPVCLIVYGAGTLFPGFVSVEKLRKPGPVLIVLQIVALAAGLLDLYAMTH
jgi:hypothetical protein